MARNAADDSDEHEQRHLHRRTTGSTAGAWHTGPGRRGGHGRPAARATAAWVVRRGADSRARPGRARSVGRRCRLTGRSGRWSRPRPPLIGAAGPLAAGELAPGRCRPAVPAPVGLRVAGPRCPPRRAGPVDALVRPPVAAGRMGGWLRSAAPAVGWVAPPSHGRGRPPGCRAPLGRPGRPRRPAVAARLPAVVRGRPLFIRVRQRSSAAGRSQVVRRSPIGRGAPGRDAFIEREPFVGRMPWRTGMPAERRRIGSARMERSGSKPATVSDGIRVLRSASISRRSGASSTQTREIASPSTPARPVRPMRWT